MKKLVILLVIFIPLLGSAQDNIIFKNGSEVQAKVIEISPEIVKYKRFDNLEGPDYTVYRREVFMVQFENGTSEVLSPIDFTQALSTGVAGESSSSAKVAKHRSPGLALLFSALVPGGGQYYNGDYWKGGIMSGLWMTGLVIAGSATNSYYYYYAEGTPYYTGGYYDAYNEQYFVGSAVVFGSWLWSVIDAPIKAASINRKNKAEATGLLEFKNADKWAMKIEPFRSQGLGGTVSFTF